MAIISLKKNTEHLHLIWIRQKYGLKLYMRNPSSYTPLATAHWKDGARSLTLSNDIEFNRREIAKFSVRDAEVSPNINRIVLGG